MSHSRSTPSWDAAELAALAQRFRAAGGKRILVSEATAELVSRALRVYADVVTNRPDNDFDLYRIEALDSGGNRAELIAKVCNGIIANATFDAAISQRPTSVVTLRKGFQVSRRHEPGPK